MSTNFPTTLDVYSDKVDGTDYPQAAHINNPQDAIEALEAKVGVDSSAVATSLDFLMKNTTSGHDHDGSDSKKVIVTNLNPTGLTASQLIRTNSAGTALESSGKTVPTGDIVGTSDSQTLTSKTLTSPVINTQVTGTAIVDEDTMVSDSAVKVPTQQSVKAYVDTHMSDVSTHGVATAIVGTTDTQTLSAKTLTSPVINTQVTGTAILDEDDMASDSNTKVATQQSIKAYVTSSISTAIAAAKSALFPVGAIYTSISATNPGTSLGFGTWAAFGAGKTLVGLDAGQAEFNVVEETGGEKTHTLSEAEMPVHTHVQNSHTHSYSAGGAADTFDGGPYNYNVINFAARTTGATTAVNQNAGSGSAHNNLQPYIVVYFWKRTA